MLLNNKIVLVTGGTGSLGKVLVRRLLSGEMGLPAKVIVFSRDEGKQHYMRLSYLHKSSSSTEEVIYKNFKEILEFRIGDVRSYADICSVLKGVDVVFNAAALKQVPTCEYFPYQALQTNCEGPNNIIRAIRDFDLPIETVVGISTDKACKPVNVMGMSKAIQERIFIVGNIRSPNTRFICVRYGNVLASRGSVIPLFHEQIRTGGPVTITDAAMTRFLLSLDQAVDTVFAALKGAAPGETYIPRVPAALMINVAKALIGDKDIDIAMTGIRPGEKVHEIMVSEEEIHHTVARGDYYAILPLLPELQSDFSTSDLPLTKEFSSSDVVLDLQGTIDLLQRNRLMAVGDTMHEATELLR